MRDERFAPTRPSRGRELPRGASCTSRSFRPGCPPVRTGGNTVPNGRPIIDETRELTSFFSCPPSWEPEEFEKFSLDGDRAAFLFVVLIAEAERAYAIEPRLAARARIMEDTNDAVTSRKRGALARHPSPRRPAALPRW